MSLRKLQTSRRRSLNPLTGLFNIIESKPLSDKLILRVLFFAIVGSLLSAAILWNSNFIENTPAVGGTLIEGLIGTPRFINPALAVTRADQDTTALIYSGLMKIGTDGVLVPDLAESVTVSADGKTYNILLRKDVRFHDDTPFTASDVAFTISLIQNPYLKSPLRGNWSGVTTEEISEYELNIVLEEAYTPFIENFTLGILPKHIWNNLPIEQVPFSTRNTEPIGTGSFSIDHIVRGDAGLIESYTLKQFTENQPVKLENIVLRFYQNEDALVRAFEAKEIMSTVHLPVAKAKLLKDNPAYNIVEEPLPRVFAIFYNQNRSSVLRDTAVRLALGTAINRSELVDSTLSGFGVPITTPVPDLSDTLESDSNQQTVATEASSTLEKATAILGKSGWVKNGSGGWEKRIDGEMKNLSITLRTANTPLFEETTEVIARIWRELGVTVQVEQYEQSDLLQAVIRPRDFEGLLFGLDMSRTIDLYPFWHSSQREDPGLNIAQYANIEVDSLLQKARSASSTDVRNTANNEMSAIMNREAPATFLFVPSLVYVLDARITTTPINGISKPYERFANVNEWYMNSDGLWSIFR